MSSNGVPRAVQKTDCFYWLDDLMVVCHDSLFLPLARYSDLCFFFLAGLLAGLDEFPTLANVSTSISAGEVSKVPYTLLSAMLHETIQPYEGSANPVPKRNRIRNADVEKTVDAADTGYRIKTIQPAGEVVHVFSHIKKTYKAQWVLLEGGDVPPVLSARCYLPPTKDKKKSGPRGKKKGGRKKDDYFSSAEDVPEESVVNAVWTPLDRVADAKYVFRVCWNNPYSFCIKYRNRGSKSVGSGEGAMEEIVLALVSVIPRVYNLYCHCDCGRTTVANRQQKQTRQCHSHPLLRY